MAYEQWVAWMEGLAWGGYAACLRNVASAPSLCLGPFGGRPALLASPQVCCLPFRSENPMRANAVLCLVSSVWLSMAGVGCGDDEGGGDAGVNTGGTSGGGSGGTGGNGTGGTGGRPDLPQPD